MKKYKKFLSVLVIITVILTSITTIIAATTTSYIGNYGTAANVLYNLGIITGSGTLSDGSPNLMPQNVCDRQTAMTILVRMFGYGQAATNMTDAQVASALQKFADKDTLGWSKKYVAYAIANGWVGGISQNGNLYIQPTTAINGNSYCLIILKLLGGTNINYSIAANQLCDQGGLTSQQATTFATKSLIRDDIFGITYGALLAATEGNNPSVLIVKLVKSGVVDKTQAAKYFPDLANCFT